MERGIEIMLPRATWAALFESIPMEERFVEREYPMRNFILFAWNGTRVYVVTE